MPNHLPRVFKIALIATLVLAIGLIIWWKVANHLESPSATNTAVAAQQPSAVAVAAVAVEQNKGSHELIDESRAARISINGNTRLVPANARGEYHRVVVPASTNITATVPFADAKLGEIIPVQAEDGGLLHGAAEQGKVTVDNDHRVTVDYQVSANDGLHRVTLRRGGESRVLEFWVGAEPPVVVRK
jgi:hypothetical protein